MAAKKKTHPATRSPRDLIPLEVAGVSYMVRPPKGYVGMVIASKFQAVGSQTGEEFDSREFMDTIDMLIDTIFVKTDAKKIRARLMDADDSLDISDLSEAFPKVVEAASGNPTTSASDS